MTLHDHQQKIAEIVNSKLDDIKALDEALIIEVSGVAIAIDKLRSAVSLVEAHLNDRLFEQASQVGYQEVSQEFVFLQRTLAGLQSATHKKEALISDITLAASVALNISVAYEDVQPYVDQVMHSSVKK